MNIAMGIDPFGKSGKADAMENVKTPFSRKKVDGMYDLLRGIDKIEDLYSKKERLKDMDVDLLNPSEISVLLRDFRRTMPHRKTPNVTISLLLNKMIQKSYDAGNNYFILETGDYWLSELCSGLEGRADRMLRVMIHGSSGPEYGQGSRHTHNIIMGTMEYKAAERCVDCYFDIEKRISYTSGVDRHDPRFSQLPRAEETDFADNSSGCTFLLHDPFSKVFLSRDHNFSRMGYGARKNDYLFMREADYRLAVEGMKKDWECFGKGSRIALADSSGNMTSRRRRIR